MALYREGKAAMSADGTVTGTDTKWQSSLSLIRPGATIMFLSSPIQMAVVNKVVSDTEIKAITTNGAVVASSDYAILLSDSLTVDGLAQDVAETLRYYQSQETVIADAVEFFKDFDFESLQNLANQIKADSEAAGASATAAAASESAAKTSEPTAKESENKANTSETNAKASETAAKPSETNAKASETAANTSETNAKSSEDKAKTSETNANASETAAKTSETNAKASETAAKNSETNAKTSETAAKTSENNAKNSEVAAENARDQVQQIIDDAGEQSTLVALAQPDGAKKSGWLRNWALSQINNVGSALDGGMINLFEYANLTTIKTVSGVDVLNWSAALKQALIDGANYKRRVRAPAGEYYIEKLDEFTNLSGSSSLSQMSTFSLVGDGYDQTVFWTDSTSNAVLHFSTCKFYFKDFSMERRNVSVNTAGMESISLMQLGRNNTISAARLGYMESVRFNNSGCGLNAEHCWDSVFVDVMVHNFGTLAFRIGVHSMDNSNNLLFIRPHLESCRYNGTQLCRGFAHMSGPGGSTRNHGITLIQPHFEPGNFRCASLYLAYPQNFTVINPQINRNDTGAATPPIDSSQASPILYVSDGVNVQVIGGQLQHVESTRSDLVAPIMKFVGISKGISVASYIETGRTSRTDLESAIDFTLSTNGRREIDFTKSSVNSFNQMSSIGDRLRIGVLNDLQKVFDFVGESYTPAGASGSIARTNIMYSNTQDQSTSQTKIGELISEGHIRLKGYLGQNITIAAGATVTVNVGQGITQRRGKYGVYGLENNNQLFTEFFNVPGQPPSPIATGTSVNLSAAQPDVSVTNKLCVYQNEQYINLENRLSAPITVSVLFFAS